MLPKSQYILTLVVDAYLWIAKRPKINFHVYMGPFLWRLIRPVSRLSRKFGVALASRDKNQVNKMIQNISPFNGFYDGVFIRLTRFCRSNYNPSSARIKLCWQETHGDLTKNRFFLMKLYRVPRGEEQESVSQCPSRIVNYSVGIGSRSKYMVADFITVCFIQATAKQHLSFKI